jgi:hypothetical protein
LYVVDPYHKLKVSCAYLRAANVQI